MLSQKTRLLWSINLQRMRKEYQQNPFWDPRRRLPRPILAISDIYFYFIYFSDQIWETDFDWRRIWYPGVRMTSSWNLSMIIFEGSGWGANIANIALFWAIRRTIQSCISRRGHLVGRSKDFSQFRPWKKCFSFPMYIPNWAKKSLRFNHFKSFNFLIVLHPPPSFHWLIGLLSNLIFCHIANKNQAFTICRSTVDEEGGTIVTKIHFEVLQDHHNHFRPCQYFFFQLFPRNWKCLAQILEIGFDWRSIRYSGVRMIPG